MPSSSSYRNAVQDHNGKVFSTQESRSPFDWISHYPPGSRRAVAEKSARKHRRRVALCAACKPWKSGAFRPVQAPWKSGAFCRVQAPWKSGALAPRQRSLRHGGFSPGSRQPSQKTSPERPWKRRFFAASGPWKSGALAPRRSGTRNNQGFSPCALVRPSQKNRPESTVEERKL